MRRERVGDVASVQRLVGHFQSAASVTVGTQIASETSQTELEARVTCATFVRILAAAARVDREIAPSDQLI